MSKQRIGDVAAALLDYVEHGKTFQAKGIMAVPASSYTDAKQWQAEINLVFKRLPLMLALSCELPNPGDFKALEVVGLPIVIVRDRSGMSHAFLNVCAHRWAPVAPEGYGTCSRHTFTCPFHGWTYGTDGKLIAVSDRAKFGEVERSSRGLKQLPCEERHGMIFVCLTPGAACDLDDYYGALLEEYADLDLRTWSFLGRRAVDGANWKITLSNFFESYHFATLHSETVARELISDVAHYEGFGPNLRIGLCQRSIRELRSIPREKWAEHEGRGFDCIRVLFPNVTGFVSSSELVTALFTQTFPGPSPGTSQTTALFCRRQAAAESEREEIDKIIARGVEEIIRKEDISIGLKIQSALASGAHDGVLYGRNEPGNQYFQEWIEWYVTGDPGRPKPVITQHDSP
jgi:phenylpropionate dioxygenase-like ring-hydroxylating dioxygenase large terminal subunit